jgi:hypothetical protein
MRMSALDGRHRDRHRDIVGRHRHRCIVSVIRCNAFTLAH